MLQLHKDIFVRLAISAKSLKAKEMEKKVKQSVINSSMSQLEKVEYPEPSAETNKILHSSIVVSRSNSKLDEKVEQIMENPEVKALKEELDKVEVIFTKLKEDGVDTKIILRIENKIRQLKRLIDDKSYV
jgi:uncharacterized protein YegL